MSKKAHTRKLARNLMIAPFVLFVRVPVVLVCNVIIRWGPRLVGAAGRLADRLRGFIR